MKRKKSSPPVKSAKKPRRRKHVLAALMPASGSKAREKKAALRTLMLLSGLLGGPSKARSIRLNSSIPEFSGFGISEGERKCLLAIFHAERDAMPKGGVALGFRIELAAAFLAMVIDTAYLAAEATGMQDHDIYAEVAIDLAVERGREIWAQDSG
jgi:hypothetical protein